LALDGTRKEKSGKMLAVSKEDNPQAILEQNTKSFDLARIKKGRKPFFLLIFLFKYSPRVSEAIFKNRAFLLLK